MCRFHFALTFDAKIEYHQYRCRKGQQNKNSLPTHGKWKGEGKGSIHATLSDHPQMPTLLPPRCDSSLASRQKVLPWDQNAHEPYTVICFYHLSPIYCSRKLSRIGVSNLGDKPFSLSSIADRQGIQTRWTSISELLDYWKHWKDPSISK